MKKLAVLLLLLLSIPAFAEKKYKIKPDSPEERMLLEIQGETDTAKRLAMLDDFTKKFADSEALPFTWQLYEAAYLQQQQYDKAIEAGEKAADADNEDLLVQLNLVRAAQAKPDFARVHKWTVSAMPLYQKALANRPVELDDDDWKKRQEVLKSYADFMEYALFDACTRDNSADKIKYIDSFAQSFPQSERTKKLPGLYALAYGQANDVPKMMASAEKAVEAEPDNEAMLLLLGDTLVSQRTNLAGAEQYANRLLKVMEEKKKPEGTNEADWTRYINTYQGGAHSVLGRSLMLQEKTAPAIVELQTAAKLLEGIEQAEGPVLYFLGFGYAKQQKYNDARTVLGRAVKLGGPYAQPSQDILKKIRAATGK